MEKIKKEQFAVYEKKPAHQKDVNGIILAPYNTKEEAEKAGTKYGYSGDNYYVDKLI
jgi:hypothetical protein